MKENEINQMQENDSNEQFYDNGGYNINQENNDYLIYNRGDESFSNEKHYYTPVNELSGMEISNSMYEGHLNPIDNFQKNRISNNFKRFTYNIKNDNQNKYSNNSMPIHIIENDNFINRNTFLNKSQEYYSYFPNNKINNYKIFNRSQLYNGNTTDEGDSYINPNRDSSYYNNLNQNRKMYFEPQMNYNLKEKDIINGDYSDEEQLIIYPERKYIFSNEQYFNKKNNEGILKPKNLETYEVKSIEYIPDEDYNNKSSSLYDYILKSESKNKLKKNKSCNNITYIKSGNKSKTKYNIKQISIKQNQIKNKLISSDILNNIKNLKEKYENKKQMNNINIIKKEDKNNKDKNHFDNKENNKNIGGIVELNDKKKYSTHIVQDDKYNNKFNNEYPSWKILASACLIQSWFRSLKTLKNPYKKNLHKIIILQKVYKMHYKNKILSGKRELNIYKNFKKETNDDDRKDYQNNNSIKYRKEIQIIANNNSDDSNYNFNYKNNNFEIYNRPNIKNINNNYSYKDNTIKKETSSIQKNFRSYDNRFIISILLMEKIIENKILKIYFDFILKLKNINNIGENIKNKDNKNKYSIKLHLEPTKNFRNKYRIKSSKNNNIGKNKNIQEELNKNNINAITYKNKNISNIDKRFLLKKLFIRLWLKHVMSLKNDTKNRLNNNKNKHVLLSNINNFVLGKLDQEVKRRKLIVFFDIICLKKYPNLKFSLKKIKKFAKVRYNVLNNYASIIQNAFRFYLENKYKEEK
jgi:hypothetical protein